MATIMKSNYVKPEMEILNLCVEHEFMSGSDSSLPVSDKTTDTYDSKGHAFDFESRDLWADD